MIYKRITIILILLALALAGSLALLKNREILSAQYKRCSKLTAEADKLFSTGRYALATQKYRKALMIDSKNQKLWQKLADALKKQGFEECVAQRPKEVPQQQKQAPSQATPQVEIPQQPSQPSFVIEEDEGC